MDNALLLVKQIKSQINDLKKANKNYRPGYTNGVYRTVADVESIRVANNISIFTLETILENFYQTNPEYK